MTSVLTSWTLRCGVTADVKRIVHGSTRTTVVNLLWPVDHGVRCAPVYARARPPRFLNLSTVRRAAYRLCTKKISAKGPHPRAEIENWQPATLLVRMDVEKRRHRWQRCRRVVRELLVIFCMAAVIADINHRRSLRLLHRDDTAAVVYSRWM